LPASKEKGYSRRWYRTDRKLPGLQFSIRTLLLAMLLAGSVMLLYQNCDVWALDRSFRGPTGEFASARFSPDGKLLVTAGDDALARLWDAATGAETLVLKGHQDKVASAEFSRDGTRILTVADDRTARVWDAQTGEEEQKLTGRFESASFSPDAHRVATAGADRVGMWRLAEPEAPAFQMEVSGVYSVSVAADDRTVAATSRDNTVTVWDTESPLTPRVVSWNTYVIAGAQYCSSGLRIVTVGTRIVRIWDESVEHAALRWRLPRIRSFAFSDDGRQFAAISQDGTASVWDLQTCRMGAVLPSSVPDGYRSVAFSPDVSRLVTVSADGSAQTWHRRRPDGRWGVLYLPEFWATLILAAALTWSFAGDAMIAVRAMLGRARSNTPRSLSE
jgi:WD40 repeat protein